jgi:hypothetical protein
MSCDDKGESCQALLMEHVHECMEKTEESTVVPTRKEGFPLVLRWTIVCKVRVSIYYTVNGKVVELISVTVIELSK